MNVSFKKRKLKEKSIRTEKAPGIILKERMVKTGEHEQKYEVRNKPGEVMPVIPVLSRTEAGGSQV